MYVCMYVCIYIVFSKNYIFASITGAMNWWKWYLKCSFTVMEQGLFFTNLISEEFMLLKDGSWGWWRQTGSLWQETLKRLTYFICRTVHASWRRHSMYLIHMIWNRYQSSWGTMWTWLQQSIPSGIARMDQIISLLLAMTGYSIPFLLIMEMLGCVCLILLMLITLLRLEELISPFFIYVSGWFISFVKKLKCNWTSKCFLGLNRCNMCRWMGERP